MEHLHQLIARHNRQEMADAAAELRRFIAEYTRMPALDPERIYTLHWGIEGREAALTVPLLRLCLAAIEVAIEAVDRQHNTYDDDGCPRCGVNDYADEGAVRSCVCGHRWVV